MLKVYAFISLGFCMHLRGHHSQEAGMSITSISCLLPLHSPSPLLFPLPQFSWLALKSGRCSLLCSFSGCSLSLMSFMNIWNIVIIMFSCLQILTFASVLDYLMTLLLIVSLIFSHLCFTVLVIYWIPDIVSLVLRNAAVWKFFIPFRSCFKTRAVPILGAVTLECWGKTHLSALSDDLCLRRFSVLPVGMDIVSGSEWIALILPGDSLVTLSSCPVHGLVFSWLLEGGLLPVPKVLSPCCYSILYSVPQAPATLFSLDCQLCWQLERVQ